MSSETHPPWPIADALSVSECVLDGRLSLIEGCIALAGYAHKMVPDWRVDPDFRIFGVVASETDHLPFGDARKLWSPSGLAKADLEIESLSKRYQGRVRDACAKVLSRFGTDKPSGQRRVILYRPVGPKELELIEASGWVAFPPRLPGQPIFYPVTNEAYAVQIARGWNVKESGAGFVTKFEIDGDYLSRYSVQQVGGSIHTEYWIPAEDLVAFNRHILGKIEVSAEFR